MVGLRSSRTEPSDASRPRETEKMYEIVGSPSSASSPAILPARAILGAGVVPASATALTGVGADSGSAGGSPQMTSSSSRDQVLKTLNGESSELDLRERGYFARWVHASLWLVTVEIPFEELPRDS